LCGASGAGRRTISPTLFRVWRLAGYRQTGISLFQQAGRGLLPLISSTTKRTCSDSGATGAGKSVLVNDMIAQALRLNPMIFIIDKGGSYERISELFAGQYFTWILTIP